MQDGVALLVIGSILAGHIFLFLQGRQMRAAMAHLSEQLQNMKAATSSQRDAAATDAGTDKGTDKAVKKALAHLERAVLGLQEPLDAVNQRLSGLESDARTQRNGGARFEEVEQALQGLSERVAGQAKSFDQLRSLLESLAVKVGPEASAASRPRSADRVLREWLGLEGFTDCVVGEPEEHPEGLRFPVRALKGVELRQGHVTLSGERIVKASLEVPTRLFP